MFSSPCQGWAPACGAVFCSLPFPLCPCAKPAHPPVPASAALLLGSHRDFLQSSGSSPGLAARSLCLFPAMRAPSPLRFTKSSHGWFAEALPSLEKKQEGAGGDSPAWEGPLFSQRPAQNAAL